MASEKVWRLWQMEQEHFEPSGFHPADALVAPGGGIELAVANHFDDAAVALGAAHGRRRRTLHVLAEHVVQ
jgi:hypothetical protein